MFLTGAVGLIGLYFTWQNTRQAQKSTKRTLELTEQGQITDRFTKAIDQLGKTDDNNDKRIGEIRLGGIYALAQIAVEDPERYHWPIRYLSPSRSLLAAFKKPEHAVHLCATIFW